MLTQIGVITALPDISTGTSTATIRVMSASACERCVAGQGCGAGLFARLLRSKATELTLPVAADARVGQRVWLTLDERLLARQAWYWYGLPIIGFLFGAAAPLWLWPQTGGDVITDGFSLLLGLILMAICWTVVRGLLRPVLPRVLLNSPCTD